jgi:hypothetical protein
MSDHEIALHGLELAWWTLGLTGLGVLIAASGIFYAVRTLKESAETAQAQFWVNIRGVLANYDDLHAKLRPGGPWAPRPGESYAWIGPASAEEWARVELFMGLFEYCETLLARGMLNPEDFRKAYKYRLENLLRNAPIVETKLIELAAYWQDFLALCKRFDVPVPTASELSE